MSYLSESKKLKNKCTMWACLLCASASFSFAAESQNSAKPSTWGNVPNFYTGPVGEKDKKVVTFPTVSQAAQSQENVSAAKTASVESQASSRRVVSSSVTHPTANAVSPVSITNLQASTTNPPMQQVSARPQTTTRGGYQVTFPTAAAQPNTYTETASAPASRVAGWKSDEKAGIWKTATVSASAASQNVVNRILHPKQSTRQSAPVGKVEAISPRSSKLDGVTQSGMASWYGPKWHGKKTANGERFDMNSMTAAHKTLPFGTLVKVRNERNGRETIVRINNRGPFTKGRILDLSKGAANKLGFVSNGVARIKMEVIGRS